MKMIVKFDVDYQGQMVRALNGNMSKWAVGKAGKTLER